jgi:hypothetical protein
LADKITVGFPSEKRFQQWLPVQGAKETGIYQIKSKQNKEGLPK